MSLKPLLILSLLVLPACSSSQPIPGQRLGRMGDEIMVCGQLFHTGAPVILWTDPGGYDAYRTEHRFLPATQPTTRPSFGHRLALLSPEEAMQVQGGNWPLELLEDKVDQFVLHYDVAGTARQCFKVLHDMRRLSVHFMLDVDGTIYQTLDLKERAWHATTSNTRSIGIEIASIGAYRPDAKDSPLDQWYRVDETGLRRIVFPVYMKETGIRTPNFIARPIRDESVIGQVQGRQLKMYDLTHQQYDSLIKLTATLCTVFPNIKCDYPRDPSGQLITRKLPDADLRAYRGILGHYHIQPDKTDPGPAFQWDYLIAESRKLMNR